MMRQLLAIAMIAVAGLSSDVKAGVDGHYEGTLVLTAGENAGQPSLFEAVDFDAEAGTFTEYYDGGSYSGTFEETDLIILSFWTAQYDSDTENWEVKGISLFGFISLYSVNQVNGDTDYSGIIFRVDQPK